MELLCGGVRETNLKLTLAFGIGIHHAGLTEKDRKVVEELFVNQKIQVGNGSVNDQIKKKKNVKPVFKDWGFTLF